MMSRVCRGGLFVVVPLLMIVLAGSPIAQAHGGGTVQAEWDGRGFYMIIETNEEPNAGTFGGIVHVTMIPTPSRTDAMTRVRNLDIHVTGSGPGGASAGPIRGKQVLSGAYEADLVVNRSGLWHFTIEVGTGESMQSYTFPLDVEPRSLWADVGVVGGLLLIPVLAVFGMVRRAQKRSSRGEGADAS